MKRAVSIICVIALMLAVVSLAGCGANGTYQLVSLSGGGVTLDKTSMASQGLSATMVINGTTATLTLVSSDGSDTVVYTMNKKTKTFVSADGDTIPYTLKGKTLTLNKSFNSVMAELVFEKQ